MSGGRELVRGRPHPTLRRHVLTYAGYREAGLAPFLTREVPRGFAVLIIGFGEPFSLGGAGAAPQRHRSFFAGLHDRPTIVGSTGQSHCLQVDLTPPGAARLLGGRLGGTANRAVALDEVLGPAAAELTERLWDAGDWPTRFAVLDRWLGSRLAGGDGLPDDLAWALETLASRHGSVRIADLARAIGCSRKHLAVRCRDRLGLSPKTLAAVFRFAAAVDRLEREPAPALAAVAQACGYSDQPHLNRDFKHLAGLTPTAFLARRLPDRGGLLERR